MTFRDRLLATIRAAGPILELPDVLVVGSEVPNLFQPDAASTLVVSQDLDIGVPVASHAVVKGRLDALRQFEPSPDEPSVWTPKTRDLLELNFLGLDPSTVPLEAYVLEDDRLPLLVFGALGLVAAGRAIELAGTRITLPRPAGLLLEKLVTDRTGEKGERDLLVAVGIMSATTAEDLDEFLALYEGLRQDIRHMVRANLTLVSLLEPHANMPDPQPHRAALAALLTRLEAVEGAPMTEVLHRRLREMRARVLAREFDYRQRHLARGVWFRLRRALALADAAYAVPRDVGELLAAEGCEVLPMGAELEPPRLILIAPPDRVAALPAARPLPVRLTAELLAAECVVLVPFEPPPAA